MYIDTVPNRDSPPAVLLRESFRQDGKVNERHLAEISSPEFPDELRRGAGAADVAGITAVARQAAPLAPAGRGTDARWGCPIGRGRRTYNYRARMEVNMQVA